jgi:RES domain-containing protein
LYASDDEATAWEEAAARYRQEGATGLPQSMHLLTLTIEAGHYADLHVESVREDFQVASDDLSSEAPTSDQQEACLRVARAVRALADFLVSPSARGEFSNVPLYPDRPDSALRLSFAGAAGGRVPRHLRQEATEAW